MNQKSIDNITYFFDDNGRILRSEFKSADYQGVAMLHKIINNTTYFYDENGYILRSESKSEEYQEVATFQLSQLPTGEYFVKSEHRVLKDAYGDTVYQTINTILGHETYQVFKTTLSDKNGETQEHEFRIGVPPVAKRII